MRIPALESLFPEPWPAAARRVLPSHSPQLTATALWGPVLAWSRAGTARRIRRRPESGARRRWICLTVCACASPGHAPSSALGFEGEESWRVAARIKVALLIEAEGLCHRAVAAACGAARAAGAQRIPILSPTLWLDPDVRWLTGAHEAEGRSYFIKESYEELLWWLQLPALCKLAAAAVPAPGTMEQIRKTFRDAAEYGRRGWLQRGRPARTQESGIRGGQSRPRRARTCRGGTGEERKRKNQRVAPESNHSPISMLLAMAPREPGSRA